MEVNWQSYRDVWFKSTILYNIDIRAAKAAPAFRHVQKPIERRDKQGEAAAHEAYVFIRKRSQ